MKLIQFFCLIVLYVFDFRTRSYLAVSFTLFFYFVRVLLTYRCKWQFEVMIAFQYGIENKNKKNNMKLSTKINSIGIFLVFYIRLVAILYDCTFLRLIAFSLVRRADSTSVHTPCVMHYCVFVYTCYCKKKKIFVCIIYLHNGFFQGYTRCLLTLVTIHCNFRVYLLWMCSSYASV